MNRAWHFGGFPGENGAGMPLILGDFSLASQQWKLWSPDWGIEGSLPMSLMANGEGLRVSHLSKCQLSPHSAVFSTTYSHPAVPGVPDALAQHLERVNLWFLPGASWEQGVTQLQEVGRDCSIYRLSMVLIWAHPHFTERLPRWLRQ